MIISNNNEYSSMFDTHCGCRQGGTISPKLFNIYVEILIEELEKTNHGVKMEHINVEVIMYADDLLLLSNTKSGLNKLLKIVETDGFDYGMKFNPDKTNDADCDDLSLENLLEETSKQVAEYNSNKKKVTSLLIIKQWTH